ncbi:unnamed protein product [Vitrella brassicaformis CCMP3155]|uniref:Rieske domain-containing protein n=2 Tax=Vitrella brassicaformis TaxID=1169539 RepID=A0A0G4G8P4_VITBC|nr:unnamed protein product [Vitrella brassicaformis CCMP3155]|eukprot:CEM25185.1 unnamed protein product [Vitrella brassicaformis CCMP3155]
MNGRQKRIVVVGNGPIGQHFLEQMVEKDQGKRYQLTAFCEEARHAYDRVKMTSFFEHRDPDKLSLCDKSFFTDNGIELLLGEKAVKIDPANKLVNDKVPYDVLVLATGSFPFVPPSPGLKTTVPGVFVYRTIEDMQEIIEYSKTAKRTAVIGGGLLGLEAAKAVYDLNVETHILEVAPYLMPTQLDQQGGLILTNIIEGMGISVHLKAKIKEILTNEAGRFCGVRMAEGDSDEELTIPMDMIVVSCGIRPRDELGRDCGLEIGGRGGVKIDDKCQTSNPDIYAIGEVASHRGKMCYGLWAPGVQQADVLVHNLLAESAADEKAYEGSDLSTKLKLLGVDVASLGASADFWFQRHWYAPSMKKLTHLDEVNGVYKKIVVDKAGTKLMGAILVGDAADYGKLLSLAMKGTLGDKKPSELIGGAAAKKAGAGEDDIEDDDLVCTCNGVTAGMIRLAVREGHHTLEAMKKCNKTGTGCGGCVAIGPVKGIMAKEMKKLGLSATKSICKHFPFSRKELFDIIKIKALTSFHDVLAVAGTGKDGCELCKPAIASILASLWNSHVLAEGRNTLQDTNDRFLANVQRNGTYSVIPRIPGGEVTPDGLAAIAAVAKEYGLYTKITGGQRIDMFGAQIPDLPDIWQKLVEAGFESGHAYAKALRTVKSCVGNTWCRYGVQDSVSTAVRLENRYKGLRSPHKLKSGVSGCVRECAEAQGKDFGLVATEKGYNVYVCGNGGARPAHAKLLAADADEETAIKYLDRFLMYYIYTADPLQRTAPWLENLEGGIEYLKQVVVHDKLGIAQELEDRMQYVVETYECEWRKVVEDPALRKKFVQFANTQDRQKTMGERPMRGQAIPSPWPKETGPFEAKVTKESADSSWQWVEVGKVSEFPSDGGAAVKYGNSQLAVFNFTSRGEWFATQNMCPHKRAFVLSRGLVGEAGDEPKVACPLHKKTFSLQTGESLSGDPYKIAVFDVKIQGDKVLLNLPPPTVIDEELATEKWAVGKNVSVNAHRPGGAKGREVALEPTTGGPLQYWEDKKEPTGMGMLNGTHRATAQLVETFGADGGSCGCGDGAKSDW